ncbi:MAG: nuclear transport factor 2 family protein [bacterium]|nr:nuclear transport factor 2 family protein [bacterium]
MDIKIQLAKFPDNFYKAYHKKNWSKVEKLLSDDFKYFTDNFTVMDKPGFMEFSKSVEWEGKLFRVSELNVMISKGEDFAVLSYKIYFEGVYDRNDVTVEAIETLVLNKEKTDWKIVHFHISNKL